MFSPSRRQALAIAAAFAALPAFAQAEAGQEDASATWDLSELYPSDAAWETERAAVDAALPGLAAHRGHLADSPPALKAALEAISDLRKRTARLGVYANLKADEDLTIAANQARRQLATSLYSRLGEATAWVDPEILAAGASKIGGLLAADPALARFRFPLDNVLRLAPHTLSADGEALLAATAEPLSGAQNVRSQLFTSDIPWPEAVLSTGKVRLDAQGYTVARTSPERADRKLAFDTFFGAMKTYESSLGAALVAQVQGGVFQAKARKYDSALSAALAPSNIPTGVYRTLVAEVNAGLPVLHRYFELRRRMLNLPDMHYYDLYPAVTKLDRRFDVAASRTLTLEAVKPLGPDYGQAFAKASAARWVHAYPRKGKEAGAYVNGGAYDVHPYMLLNHTGDFEALTTYAHEWGHAMHSVMANAAQPFETADYPTFTAEVASTVNEALLSDLMLKGAKTRDEKLFYLDRVCETARATFFRQTMFAEFELYIHETTEKGEALTGESLTKAYLDLLRKYHGPKVTIDPAYAVEWAYIPHFYYNFYVFQYATSVSAATLFADRLRTGRAADRNAYLAVLKAGGSDYPVDLLKRAGVDLTSPAPYRSIIGALGRTVDQMEKLLG